MCVKENKFFKLVVVKKKFVLMVKESSENVI